MRGSTTFWGAVAVFGLATTTSSSVAAHPSSSFQQQRARREVAADAAALSGQTVDYVIVGGGNAGLVIANRLSEDANVTVAVIEAGSSGYESNRFDSPAGTYYNSPGGPQSPYDWNYLTVPQQHMDGNPRTWPRGRVLGGSTGINGMYLIRASQPEHDSWAQLNDASPVWGWDNFLTGMKKSETFTGPDSSVPFQIPYNDQSRGSSGPLHATYPGASYPVVDGFINAMASLGSPLNSDPYNGDNTGSYVGTAAINPSNWTRSFARSAYLDPFAYRQNLRVLAGAHVTKVNFQDDDQTQQGNKRAVSVTYQANANSQAYTLNANREVILTAGAVGTPQVLQLSGVGPKQHLDSVGVDTVIDLPGVGHGVSDHLVTSVSFTPAQGAALPPSRVTTDAKVDSYINTATSYVNLTTLFGSADEASQFITGLRSNLSSIVESYDAPPAVKRGYNATLTETLRLLEQGTAPMEMLFASVFGGVQIQLALQHSLSRGTVLIGSANPFEYPIIDPHYGQQNADIVLLRAAMKLARRAGASQAFQQYAGVETGDTTGATDDNAIDAHIRRAAQTEYHPAGSCAMLPYDQGGVVDQTLLVYNTTNLRVIDGSVPPSPLSTHLMTVVYGMAEIGADIIKAAARGQDYNGISPTRQVRHTNDSSSSSSSEGSKGRTGDAASGSGSSSGASAQGISSLTMMASASALVGLVSLL